MKHQRILEQLVEEEKKNPNTSGVLVYGSVASGTQREDSDLDVFLVYREHKPSSGLYDVQVEGIKVGRTFFTYDVLAESVDSVPCLLHMVGRAKLLLDRYGTIQPLLAAINKYFETNSELEAEWRRINDRLKEEKREFGCEQTTIIEVWNDLERRYSGGAPKRTFFTYFG